MWIFEETIREDQPIILSDYLNRKSDTMVSVQTNHLLQVNDRIVSRKDFDRTLVKKNDRIIIFPLLGGG